MKAVKHTGLVPVRSKQGGPIFGVPPKNAAIGVRDGDYFLVPIPEDIETIDVDTKVEGPKVEEKAPEYDVKIPDEWEALHDLVRIKLAKSIDPDFKPVDNEKPLEAADRVIRAELAKRGGENEGGDQAGKGKDNEPEVVEIPEDWAKLHHFARIALAESISGGDIKLTDEQKDAGVKTTEVADQIIRAELERRAAAEPPAK